MIPRRAHPHCMFLVKIFILAMFGFVVCLVGPAFAQISSTLRSKATDVDSLVAKASRGDGVRVIVTLRSATPTPESRLLPSTSIQKSPTPDTSGPLGDGQSATVEQLQVLDRYLGVDATKRQRWSPRLIRDTPYLAITVNLSDLEALANDSVVVSIHEEGELHPGLQNSVPIIGAPAAYDFDYNSRGWPWAVAILDTGVQYDHPFIGSRITGAACFSTASPGFATLCPNGTNTQAGGNAGTNCGIAGCAHGTHVAGIAAGNRAAGTPSNGVARLGWIYAVQVFRRNTGDNSLSAADGDLLAALADIRHASKSRRSDCLDQHKHLGSWCAFRCSLRRKCARRTFCECYTTVTRCWRGDCHHKWQRISHRSERVSGLRR